MELWLEWCVGVLCGDVGLGDLGHFDGSILEEGRGECDHSGWKAGDLVVYDGGVMDV